jgi:nucleoside 2-deoxyribosyltransferase
MSPERQIESREVLPGRGRKVYIGGSLDYRSVQEVYQEHEHINQLLEEKGFVSLDPMRSKWSIFLGQEKIERSDRTMQEIVGRDLQDLNECDFHLILTGERASWGTAIEMGYSIFVTKKPVILVVGDFREYERAKEQRSWHTFLAVRVVNSFEEAVDYMSNYWT